MQHNDLLSGIKRGFLAEFSNNDVVRDEIGDVLNMRFADLSKCSLDGRMVYQWSLAAS